MNLIDSLHLTEMLYFGLLFCSLFYLTIYQMQDYIV